MTENKDYGFGKCWAQGCDKYAVLGVNGKGLCIDHMNEAFKRTGFVLKSVDVLKQSKEKDV